MSDLPPGEGMVARLTGWWSQVEHRPSKVTLAVHTFMFVLYLIALLRFSSAAVQVIPDAASFTGVFSVLVPSLALAVGMVVNAAMARHATKVLIAVPIAAVLLLLTLTFVLMKASTIYAPFYYDCVGQGWPAACLALRRAHRMVMTSTVVAIVSLAFYIVIAAGKVFRQRQQADDYAMLVQEASV